MKSSLILTLTSFTSLKVLRYLVRENKERSCLFPMNSLSGMPLCRLNMYVPQVFETTMMSFKSLEVALDGKP